MCLVLFWEWLDKYGNLFWLASKPFAKVIVRPVLLLVDGHSSHIIDLHVSKFCKDNSIHLYCLPPHSSHVLQPLDVTFFKPLKLAWGKVYDEYRLSHPGCVVTKYVFADAFREAWISSIRMSTIINGFRESGLCPLNSKAIPTCKLTPSLPYSNSTVPVVMDCPKSKSEKNVIGIREAYETRYYCSI